MTVEHLDSADVCPSPIDVAAAISGNLPDPAADLIFQHLTECGACAETVPDLSVSNIIEQALWKDIGQTGRTNLDPNFVRDVVSRIQRTASTELAAAEIQIDLRTRMNCDTTIEIKFDFLSPPHSPDEIGRLGDYAVLGVLDRGGMGIIFLATDLKLHRPVALKVMKQQLATDPDARKRYLREAQAIAAIRHEHIVTIYQVGEVQGVPFLAMELLEGESLNSRLDRELKLPIAEAMHIGREIAEALAAAHAKELIHRDIKPANIWLERPSELTSQPDQSNSEDDVCRFPTVKLLDFGLVRTLDDIDNLTQSGTILGTPAYMAPEQASGGTLDARADLFSLGVTLYRMTTGQMAFAGGKLMATLNALANSTPQAPKSINPDVPQQLSDLIEQLLAKEANSRPESAAVVAAKLAQIEQSGWKLETSVGPGLELDRKNTSRGPTTPKRIVLALLGFVVLVFLTVVIVTVTTNDKKKTEISIDVPGPVESVTTTIRELEGPSEFEKWMAIVAGLTPEKQVEEVAKKLKELNSDFDGKVTHKIEDGVVSELQFVTDCVRNISPVRALTGLRELNCCGGDWGKGSLYDLSPLRGMRLKELLFVNTQVADLSPLKGMALVHVNFANTRVSDISALEGMPLRDVGLYHSRVEDLSPLRGAPLDILCCDSAQITDLTPLEGMYLYALGITPEDIVAGMDVIRKMKTIKVFLVRAEKIPADEFWTRYDAGEFSKKED